MDSNKENEIHNIRMPGITNAKPFSLRDINKVHWYLLYVVRSQEDEKAKNSIPSQNKYMLSTI